MTTQPTGDKGLPKPPISDPVTISVVLAYGDVWHWSVDYEKDDAGLSQNGRTDTLDEAMRCVQEAIENGRTSP